MWAIWYIYDQSTQYDITMKLWAKYGMWYIYEQSEQYDTYISKVSTKIEQN